MSKSKMKLNLFLQYKQRNKNSKNIQQNIYCIAHMERSMLMYSDKYVLGRKKVFLCEVCFEKCTCAATDVHDRKELTKKQPLVANRNREEKSDQ